MPEPAAALSWAYDCLFLWNIYLFLLRLVFGFSVHLLTSPRCSGNFPRRTHHVPPFSCTLPDSLAWGQDLLIGQGLSHLKVLHMEGRGESHAGAQAYSCYAKNRGQEVGSNNMPKPMPKGSQLLGTRQRARMESQHMLPRSSLGFPPVPEHRQLGLRMAAQRPHTFTWDRRGERRGTMLAEGLCAHHSPYHHLFCHQISCLYSL